MYTIKEKKKVKKSKNQLDLADFIALPGMLSTQVEVSPGVFVPVDSSVLSSRRDDLKAYCLSIPQEELTSWKSLLPRTNNNALLAKLLITLGDQEGVWVKHPPNGTPYAWLPDQPVVLIHSVVPKSRVPKPSAGDLEVNTVVCERCGICIGKFGSVLHDYVEASPGSKCISDDPETCEMAEQPEKATAAAVRATTDPEAPSPTEVEAPDSTGPALSGIDAYLRSLNDE